MRLELALHDEININAEQTHENRLNHTSKEVVY
jgi:hypothetical protein